MFPQRDELGINVFFFLKKSSLQTRFRFFLFLILIFALQAGFGLRPITHGRCRRWRESRMFLRFMSRDSPPPPPTRVTACQRCDPGADDRALVRKKIHNGLDNQRRRRRQDRFAKQVGKLFYLLSALKPTESARIGTSTVV